MKRPSRDQLGTFSSAGSCVSRRRPEPSTPIVQMSQCPSSRLRVEGDRAAVRRPARRSLGAARAAREPRRDSSRRRRPARSRPPSPARSDSKAIRRPSGEYCGLQSANDDATSGVGEPPELEPVDVGVPEAPGRTRDGPGCARSPGPGGPGRPARCAREARRRPARTRQRRGSRSRRRRRSSARRASRPRHGSTDRCRVRRRAAPSGPKLGVEGSTYDVADRHDAAPSQDGVGEAAPVGREGRGRRRRPAASGTSPRAARRSPTEIR